MLLMMAKLSTGWTLSSSFSTLDPKQLKQISIGVIAVSVFEVCFCHVFVNRAGDLHGGILSEIVSTDRTRRGL